MDKKYDVAICLELVFQKSTSSKMDMIWKNVGKLTMTAWGRIPHSQGLRALVTIWVMIEVLFGLKSLG